MNKGYLVLLALVACLTGCVPVDSLNPLYTGKDIVFDESLLGYWVGPDGGKEGGVEFSRLEEYGEKGYVVTIFTDGKKSPNDKMVFHARLVKLGKAQFLDMVASAWDAEPESFSLQIKSDKEGTKIEPALLKLGASSYLEFSDGTAADSGKIQATLRPAHWSAKSTKHEKNSFLSGQTMTISG
jgi:hypothetical protein